MHTVYLNLVVRFKSMKSIVTIWGQEQLWPTGKSQGGHYFYSLTSGRRLNRNKWMLLPMPMEVIERVHQLAGKGLT